MDAQMKAMVVREHGPASVVRPERVPVPVPGVKQVLIKVRACALNHLDLWCRNGIPGVKLPLILGCDVAGVVQSLGPGVEHIQEGSAVLADPGLSCGTCRQCLAGDQNLCRQYHILGAGVDGGYAEYVALPATNCLPVPAGLDFQQAASIPLVFLTAWHMLLARAGLTANETVLVVGGGSGVGIAGIQIAKLMRARVIATVGDEDKAAKAEALGADDVIIHGRQSIKDEVKRLTGKQGVDVVFEHVGPAVLEDCLASLATGGRLVTCGATTGASGQFDITRLFMKHQTIYGSIMGSRKELIDLLPFFAQGLLRPVVDSVFPLSQAAQAHEHMEARKHFGKIVLDPAL